MVIYHANSIVVESLVVDEVAYINGAPPLATECEVTDMQGSLSLCWKDTTHTLGEHKVSSVLSLILTQSQRG